MRQRKALPCFLVLVGSLLLGVVDVVKAQQEQSNALVVSGPTVKIPPMSRAFIDYLFDSLRSKSSFSPPALEVSQQVDANTSGMWAGTKTTVETELSEVVLRFKPTIEARLERADERSQGLPALAESFDVTVRVGADKLSIQHSLAEGTFARVGVSSTYSDFEPALSRTEYFPGFKDAGLYLSVPKMSRSDTWKAWGMLVCPRRLVITPPKRGGEWSRLELQPSPYELGEVKMTWAARAHARFPGATKKERITIQMSLTDQMPQSREHRDEVVALSPMLGVTYQPTTPFTFLHLPHEGALQQGILFSVEMQNAAGYIRNQQFSHVGYVQRLDEPSPVSIVIKGLRVPRDEGACYIVASQRSVWSRYDRKPPPQ